MSELRRRLELALERLSPRERTLVAVAAGVALTLLVWLVAGGLAEHRRTLRAQIAAAERDVTEVTALRDRYLRLRAESDAVRRRLSQGGNDFSLFSHLEGLTREVVGRERVAAMNPSSRSVSDDLRQEDVELRLSGVSLRDVTSLLYRVEKGELPLVVSRLQMKKRYDQPYVFDTTLVVARLQQSGAAQP